MSENIKVEDIIEKDSTSESKVEAKVEETQVDATEQDPLKTELERVQKDPKKEREKAERSLHFNAQRVKELGGDPNAILGIKVETEEDYEDEDSKPVTKGELRKMIAGNATKTALQLADEIADNTEKELVRYYLENRITPSGDSTQDFKDARRLVNSLRNERILEEASRKTAPKTHSNASSVDAKQEKEVVYTPDELTMMKPPFNMSSKEVLEARAGKKFTFTKK